MGLKTLLTNLSEGIQDYPNHNTSFTDNTGTGFNYGNSTTRIFDNLPFVIPLEFPFAFTP